MVGDCPKRSSPLRALTGCRKGNWRKLTKIKRPNRLRVCSVKWFKRNLFSLFFYWAKKQWPLGYTGKCNLKSGMDQITKERRKASNWALKTFESQLLDRQAWNPSLGSALTSKFGVQSPSEQTLKLTEELNLATAKWNPKEIKERKAISSDPAKWLDKLASR